MTAFAVYGVLFSECEKDARKKTPTEIRKGDQIIELTEKEWLEEVNNKAEQSFKRNKPKKISVLFDAPQFCHDFIKLCKNVRSKEVHIRRPNGSSH